MDIRDVTSTPAAVQAKYFLNLLIENYPWAVLRYDYHGSGDSQHDTWFVMFETWDDYQNGNQADVSDRMLDTHLQLAIEAFCDMITETHHPGYEQNDGGHGQVEFLMRPQDTDPNLGPRVIQNHWDYVQEEAHQGEHVY